VRLNDAYYGTDIVQILRKRIVYVFSLSDREHATISVQRRLNGLNGSGSPGRDGYGDPGVYDGIPKW
jgi:hypothetical protein